MILTSKNYQLLFFLLFIFLPHLSYAVPPYLSISVGENLSFHNMSCLQTAKIVLNQNGFQNIAQYKGSRTLFAASYKKNKYQYQYKALVKCLPKDGVVIVVVVADSMKNIKQKANYLRGKIQKNIRTRHAQIQRVNLVKSVTIPPYFGISVGKRAFASESVCLQAAKNSLDNEGFEKIKHNKKYPTLFAAYRNRNPYHYKAVIKCMPQTGLVIVVTVANSMKKVKAKAEKLLQKIGQLLSVERLRQQVLKNNSIELVIPAFKPEGTEDYKRVEVLEQQYKKLEQRLEQKIAIDCKCFKALKFKLEELKQQIAQIKTQTLLEQEIGKVHKRFKALELRFEQVEQQLAQKIVEDHQMREENRKQWENDPGWQKEQENITSESEKAHQKNPLELTSDAWEHTILSQSSCLIRAKSAIKKSGFSDHFEVNEYSVKGINRDEYIGLIRCVTDEEFVFFWIKGEDIQRREELLIELQTHF